MVSSDPFRTPASGDRILNTAPPSPGASFGKLDLLRIIKFVFESPQWTTNILWTSLGFLFSGMVVGMLAILGYQMDIVIAENGKEPRRYPDFDINRIGDYLLRGLWVWLSMMVVSIAIGFLLLPFFIILLFVILVLAGDGPNRQQEGMGIIVGIASTMIGLVGNVLIMAVVAPITLRVGLTGNFADCLDWRWHLDFIRRTFWSLIGGTLFFIPLIAMYLFFGAALCCVGIIPAIGWFYLSQAQFYSQIYRIYLQRGGTPIAIVPIGQQRFPNLP
ncbi:MAG: hypothetical protein RLY14_2035 [Planctomycetota bacterium]|jgi:hypothetical protein